MVKRSRWGCESGVSFELSGSVRARVLSWVAICLSNLLTYLLAIIKRNVPLSWDRVRCCSPRYEPRPLLHASRCTRSHPSWPTLRGAPRLQCGTSAARAPPTPRSRRRAPAHACRPARAPSKERCSSPTRTAGTCTRRRSEGTADRSLRAALPRYQKRALARRTRAETRRRTRVTSPRREQKLHAMYNCVSLIGW